MEDDYNRPHHDYFTRAGGDELETKDQLRAICSAQYDAIALQLHALQHRVKLDGDFPQVDPNRVRLAMMTLGMHRTTSMEQGHNTMLQFILFKIRYRPNNNYRTRYPN